MEVVAADLSLLGMPFLLCKAANAASDFDARECPETAEAFLRACLDVRALFDHPELAGLGAVAAQLNPPPVIPLRSPNASASGGAEGSQASKPFFAGILLSHVQWTLEGRPERYA